jgi:acyl-CoA reductase-like NAD-dependent aldehyde dehydrogenase
VQIDAEQFDKILSYIHAGKEAGATLKHGAHTPCVVSVVPTGRRICVLQPSLLEVCFRLHGRVYLYRVSLYLTLHTSGFPGGKRVGDKGYFIEPTVFADVKVRGPSMLDGHMLIA